VAAAPARPATTQLHWRWPAQGRLLRRFDSNGTGKKGIAIGGRLNSPVVAAAGGRVVYRGSGLVGYGRLIIVKHNNNYLSAYGHNQELLVDEGDQVRAGQLIARMGSSGTNQVMLHFEIRQNGKPVDPLKLLPRDP
jgi:lipoprotein NlpD